MDIRNMRQLLAVRRYGSFAKTAIALGISQPTLSASIARLEDRLKVKLFDRTSTGSQLTPIGELIADRAGKVVAETEQIIRDAELVAGGEGGTIRLGIGTALRPTFLPRFAVALAEQYPSLNVQVEVIDRDRLLPLVKSRDLDLVICALGREVASDDLVAMEVLQTVGVAVAHPGHPLVGETGVSTARFSDYPGGGAGLEEFASSEILGVAGPARPVARYQSNDYDPLLALALAGHATLLAPLFVVQPYLASGQLKRIDLDWEFKVSFAAIASRAASYAPMVGRLVQLAVALGGELQDEAGAGEEAKP